MPKEYVHFCIAERAATLLAGTRFGKDLSPLRGPVRAALLLGAVFHDALFYLDTPGRRESQALLELPHQLHGKKGQDTHALLRAQAAHAALLAATPDGPLARAFLVGLAAHLRADVALHPLIYHLSGDYYNEPGAVERHRLLESCLDLGVAGSRAQLRSRRLAGLLRQCDPVPLAPLEFLAGLAGCDSRNVARALRRSWRVFARMHSLALSPLGAALALLRPHLPRRFRPPREIMALLYPPVSSVLPILRRLGGTLAFRQPFTGQARTTTISALLEEAAQETVRLCGILEPAAFADEDPAEALGRGPGLDSGLEQDQGRDQDTARPRYFAEPRFPEI